MGKDIFEYQSYKGYLNEFFHALPKRGYGKRTALAQAIGCPSSHVSQVLGGDFHFSLEQADVVNRYIGHSKKESAYFLLLVQRERAGTATLKQHFEELISDARERHLNLKERFEVKKSLSPQDQATYYSSWLYSVVHIMLTIEKLQTREAIAKQLSLPLTKIDEVLEFLVSIGLAIQEKGRFKVGPATIFLGSDSPMISKHHINWRLQAMQSLEKSSAKDDLHYSSVISISASDRMKIKVDLVRSIQSIKNTIRDSKEEEVHSFCIDFFRV